MNPTTINTLVTILGIVVGLGLFASLGIERRKRRDAAVVALDATIRSIREGRQVKIAVWEDFGIHSRLVRDIRPYLIRRNRLDTAMKKYEQWHDTIRKTAGQSPLMILGADWPSEIEETLIRLETIKKAI